MSQTWERDHAAVPFVGLETIGEWETKLARAELPEVLETITAIVLLLGNEKVDKVDGRSMIYFALGCAKTLAKRHADQMDRLARELKRAKEEGVL